MNQQNLGGLRAPIGLSLLSMAAALALSTVSISAAAATARLIQPRVTDLGVASPNDSKTVTIALAVRDASAMDVAVSAVSDPSSPSFRHFITPAQFAATYGQTPAAIAQVVSFLQSAGFTINKVHPNNLLITATATNAQIAAAFGTPIHAYTQNGIAFQAPATAAVVPTALSGIVSAVSGLSNKPMLLTNRAQLPNSGALAGDVLPKNVRPNGAVATQTPGFYTVGDLAAKYNINPLYGKGYSGAGKTIGIATLAGYDQSDAYFYWADVGLTVNPARITDVAVDGGADSNAGPGTEGAGETTLDVEQSGGVAPGANLRVYIAPNTDSGFIDVFAQPIEEDLVDVLSISWGSPEEEFSPSEFPTFHALFSEAALQGIPVISAAGDAGAYDFNRGLPYPACAATLSVDYPASDPLVLAAGGTTLPNSVQHKFGVVTETAERPWGWDYLRTYIVQNYGTNLYYASYYTVGGGGGVSVDFALPAYQSGLAGVQTSAKAQSLLCGPPVVASGFEVLDNMPVSFPGRNVPDVSLDADPYSGYLLYFGGGYTQEEGGTSFVSPQLNGIFTLISQGIPTSATNPKGRIGMPATQLYAAFKAKGYGAGSPFTAITTGDNEYYKATNTYNPASGLGSLDVNALAATLGAAASVGP